MLRPSSIFFKTLFFCASFFIFSCGNNSGSDPHLSIEEIEELTEINLVGKWKIRRPASAFGKSASGLKNEPCNLDEIEFFEDGSYLLLVSTVASGGDDKKIYRGKYGIAYTEANNEITLTRIVLMDENYNTSSTVPEVGTIATLTELDLTSTNISFTVVFGEGTSTFCTTGTAVELSGEKSEAIAPDANEDSNHAKLTKAWRLIQISATVEGTTDPNGTQQNLCYFLEGERQDRCEDDNGNIAEDCPYTSSLTLLISEYGTYLFTFYNASGNILSEELGDWRWRETTPSYTEFEVKAPDETYSESSTVIYVRSITESTLTLREISQEEDEEGNAITLYLDYEFQLASSPYQNTECSTND